jgi:UDP-3-O-[3-hydroxymyristoyl] N-acetylglucosamine deacetylase
MTVIPVRQRTLASAADFTGVGLHSGQPVRMKIMPAPVNHGIKFLRTDLAESPVIPAVFRNVVDTSLATVLGSDGAIVSTIEHLMACLAGLSVDNALIALDAYEVPVMDGSAGPFAREILAQGIREQEAPRHFITIRRPVELEKEGKFVGIYPGAGFSIHCEIEFDHPVIGRQALAIDVDDANFQAALAGARTFGFFHEVEAMQRFGLARGGSLENAVVVDREGILNREGLRYRDEFVRHKVVDCIGDFSLMGMPILGRIVTRRSGHAFNHAFLKKLFAERGAWETRTFEDPVAWPDRRPKALAL